MFDFLKKKTAPSTPALRDLLFGDAALSEWPPPGTPGEQEPWTTFLKAAQCLSGGEREEAVQALQAVLDMPNLDSRHSLQAWHALRQLDVSPPPPEQKRVLGVVMEVGMPKGTDIVAGYEDLSARYLNFSGAAVIWERPDDSLDTAINKLLNAGKVVALKIGPWLKPRPAAPPSGDVRISMLTPSGLHFGQGRFDALAADSLAGPLIIAGTELMQRLIEKSKRPHPSA